MAKIACFLLLLVMASSLNATAAAVHKKKAGFVIAGQKPKKMRYLSEECLTEDCEADGTCTDPTCKCATEVKRSYPNVCIKRDCLGRSCINDDDCKDPTCGCSNKYEGYINDGEPHCLPEKAGDDQDTEVSDSDNYQGDDELTER